MNQAVITQRRLAPFSPVPAINRRLRRETITSGNLLTIMIVFAAHVPLTLIIYKFPIISALHALAIFALGLWWAVSSRPNLFKVACVGAYITGAEVIWRMSEAQIFWEYGKYATAALFIIALWRSGRTKPSILILLYFLLLLPSAVMVFADQDFASARRAVSFNLSGPFALMVAVWFFSNLKLTREQLQQLLLSLILPLVSIAFITLFVTVTTEEITFGTQSSKALSGGFGPNQVSAALGLGFLATLLVLLFGEKLKKMRVVIYGMMLFLGAQSLMTFSRGGMYNALGAGIFASFFLLRDSRIALKLIVVVALTLVIAAGVILPRMNAVSGGALFARFQSTNTTHRGELAETDFQIWSENPVLGVGPGAAPSYREKELGQAQIAHTEFTRLLSEHGTFGFFALLLLLVAGVRNLVGGRDAVNKALAAAAIGWSFLFMTNAGMRLVAPAFMVGLAFVTLIPDKSLSLENLRRARRRIIRSRARVGRFRPSERQPAAMGQHRPNFVKRQDAASVRARSFRPQSLLVSATKGS